MLAKRIIPCLDVMNGRVVKGINFLKLKDAGDPVELAKIYDAEGADELAFLDITASHQKRSIIIDVVKKVADEIFIPFTVGGGINDISDISNILTSGADKVSINTAAVKNPDLIRESSDKFGSQCITIAIDAKRVGLGWEAFVNGGRTPTGLDAVKWAAQAQKLGCGELLLTSMDRDGTKIGYDIELTKAITSNVSIPVIASGGAGTLAHIYEVLTEGGADAALLASLLHYGELKIKQIKEYLENKNVPVRE